MQFIREPFERFIRQETFSSILLLIMAVVAIILANTGLSGLYHDFLNKKITVGIGDILLSKNIILWINDGLMAIFFFVIGLEIKREIQVGELSDPRKAALPVFAALGGMIFPLSFFLLLNRHPESQGGWAIPMATDIAFTLGILKLLGNKVPYGLKVFLTVFAIVDDLGAIVVIAFFYTDAMQLKLLIAALSIILALFINTRFGLYSKYVYFLCGVVVWFLFLKSGVHATIAGVLMAMVIPIRRHMKVRTFCLNIRDVLDIFRRRIESDEPEKVLLSKDEIGAVNTLESLVGRLQSPLQYLENRLHDWVVFVIMPLFAFANAGVAFNAENISGLSWIIAISLVAGNVVGISLFSWIALKTGLARLPANVRFTNLLAISILGGFGFTMSLFITNLAFADQALINSAKTGILMGSCLAGVLGYLALRLTLRKDIDPEEED